MKNFKLYIILCLLLGISSLSIAQSTPMGVLDTNKNWISVNTYDITEKRIGASVSFYDDLGKGTQAQVLDPKTRKIWTSETLYDHRGRPAVQTLSAPIGRNTTNFSYTASFIKKTDGTAFTISDYEKLDVENPEEIGSYLHTLGWYYSENNIDDPNTVEKEGESYQDITDRPYSRTIYSELNPGAVLKTIGGNKINGEWKNSHVFSMPAGQELTQTNAFADPKYKRETYKIIKTVARDVQGVETVVFTDTDGKTLAAARSGNEEGNRTYRASTVIIREQGYVDIHIPVGTQGITITRNSGIQLEIYNLITEGDPITTLAGNLPSGFYRIAVKNMDTYVYNPDAPITIEYKENYYEYSLNYYDKAGRLISTKQPLNKLESTFDYNALGQLTHTSSPDEGHAWFLYKRDGQIRFSVNSKQLKNKQFSYTNYDKRGRPVESGVFTDNDLIYLDLANTTDPFIATLHALIDTPDGDGLADANCSERHTTTYDALQDTSQLPANYKNPSFLASNVAKTQNTDKDKNVVSTTYYSYDIYGRVQWLVQNIAGLGIKTIDYEYDAVTSQVNRAVYQKGQADEFIHKYTYDASNYSLVKVETAANGGNYIEHATYDYYETGGLKRINLAQGLQGIDYVYNLNGALKSINNPNQAHDPGGDTGSTADVFGMNLHYYNNDYTRTNTPKPVSRASVGIDQYNGNIKAITWDSKEHQDNDPNSYYYKYNKNNWLEGASFNIPISNGDPTLPQQETKDQAIALSETVLTTQAIYLKPGFSIKATSDLTFNAKIDNGIDVDSKGDYNVFGIAYDANGNIKSLNRNKSTYNGSNTMDKLAYHYKADKPNQLLRVEDAIAPNGAIEDIDNQEGANYEYNDIGQLIKNESENITYLYNASGLVTEVKRENQTMVKFFYNDRGHRVRKEFYNPLDGTLRYIDHYVRDASGNAIAIYRNQQLEEYTIFGAGRLGVYKSHGARYYQLTDHLGNVRGVVGRNAAGEVINDLDIATDYYPFGMPMPGRNQVGDYRYAYQGQEKDPETGKEAFELRLWDSRIGRWLTTDPYGEFASPYLGMGNNPISNIDPDGGCVSCLPSFETLQSIGDAAFIYGEGGFLSSNYFLDEVVVTSGIDSDFQAWKFAPVIPLSSAQRVSFAEIQNAFTPNSGNPLWGNGTDDSARKIGPGGEKYKSYDANEFIQPGGGGGSFKALASGRTYDLIKVGIKGIQTGLGVQGHYDAIKTKLDPNGFNSGIKRTYYTVKLDTRSIDSSKTKMIWLHGSKNLLNRKRDSIRESEELERERALNYYD